MLDGSEDEKMLRNLLKKITRLAASLARKKKCLIDGINGQDIQQQTEDRANRWKDEKNNEQDTNDEYDIHDAFYQQSDSDGHSNRQDDESVGEDNKNNINDIDQTLF
jgi:hypothetical protein